MHARDEPGHLVDLNNHALGSGPGNLSDTLQREGRAEAIFAELLDGENEICLHSSRRACTGSDQKLQEDIR